MGNIRKSADRVTVRIGADELISERFAIPEKTVFKFGQVLMMLALSKLELKNVPAPACTVAKVSFDRKTAEYVIVLCSSDKFLTLETSDKK